MSRRDQVLAALRSFGRVLGSCLATAYLSLGKASPLDLRAEDLRPFAGAVLAALVLTAINWLRKSETSFGRGADVDDGPVGVPGSALPPLPESAYPPGAVDLPDAEPADDPLT